MTQKEKEKTVAESPFHLVEVPSSRSRSARTGGGEEAGADPRSVPAARVWLRVPTPHTARLPLCTAWERPAPSVTLPFFPAGPEGTFRSLSFVLSARRQLCPGLALGTCRAWGQTGRGGSGWTAAFLCPGSAAIGPLFLLEASGLGELEGSSELIASTSSLIASRIPLQPCSQHLFSAYTSPVTGISLPL